MSWEATSYVKRLRETPRGRVFTRTEKLLLMVLADYHNAEVWLAWPAVASLAEDCLSSRQWVMKVLAGLVAEGVLAVCAPPAYVTAGQHWARRAYAFVGLVPSPKKVVNPVDRLPESEGGQLSGPKAVNSGGEGGQLSGPKAVNSGAAGKEIYQPPLEPQTRTATGRSAPAAPASPAKPQPGKRAAQPRREALEAWAEACGWVRAHVLLPDESAAAVGAWRPPPPELPAATEQALVSVGAKRLREALLRRPREVAFCRREFLEAWALLAPGAPGP